MECPVCGDEFPEVLIQDHAWDCDGSKLPEEGARTLEGAAPSALIQGQDYQRATSTGHLHQQFNEAGSVVSSDTPAVPQRSTEVSQEVTEEERHCPLCSHYFPADQIEEHAAFCNGPSYSRAQEPRVSSYSQAQEPRISSYSQAQEPRVSSYSRTQEPRVSSYSQAQEPRVSSYSRDQEPRVSCEEGSSTVQLFWSFINSNKPVVPGAVAEGEGHSGVLSNRGAEADNMSDIEKAVQYLIKLEHHLAQDPEFKQVFRTLLKNPNPLPILQSLSNTIFSRSGTKGAAPVFLFFQLAKLFLPTILQSEAFAAFKKWVEVFILEMVVPWISRMGGWGAVLSALGVLLASGLLVGLVMLLKTLN
uniref:uncharacterized protein isoform X1 n=1 Tax=Pristiophorus japonicus TaxID=55135 RepID=UPI00398EB8E3